MDDGFVFDQFRAEPDKLPQQVQYDKLRAFVEECRGQLSEVENTLDDTFGDVWDPLADCIALEMEPRTQESIEEMLGIGPRDNKIFFKMMLIFPSICSELYDLIAEAKEKIIPPLLVFGEQPEGKELEMGEVQLCFGRILPLLMDMWNFRERVYTVVANLVRQLASLYSPSHKKRSQLAPYREVHFRPVWVALADALGILICLDEVIRQNEAFTNTATVYKRMMRSVRSNPEKYETEAAVAKRFEYLMQKLEGDLMDDLIFQNCVDRDFDSQANNIIVRENPVFQEEFRNALATQFSYLVEGIERRFETDKRYAFVGFCGLYVFYYTLFKSKLRKDDANKKFFKQIWETQRKVAVVYLGGNTVFCPSEWLSRRVPDVANACYKDVPKDILAAKTDAFTSMDAGFEGNVNRLYSNIVTWASRFESSCSYDQDPTPQQRASIAQGVQYAYDLSNLMRTMLMLHINLDRPLSVTKVLLLCKCVELLKSLQGTYHRKTNKVANLLSLICDQINFMMTRQLAPLKTKLKDAQRRLDDSQIDQLSAVELMLHALKGAPTRGRMLILRTAMSVAAQKGHTLVKESDFLEVERQLRALDLVSNFQTYLADATDCSFLSWYKSLIPIYFRSVFRNPEICHSLPLVLAALHDPAKVLLKAKHLSDPDVLLASYKKEIKDVLHAEITIPLQKEIEKDLRLHIHSVVLGQDSRDLKTLGKEVIRDHSRFVKMPPLRFFGELLSFRDLVRHYLDTQFYTLTAISPHDWKTYEEMRALTKEKYDLTLTEVHLPGATLEQGLDMVEVTRNIHLFVARYTYNLNEQLFIEKPDLTQSKNLHTIHIRHVANSIRTHGTGIMNTTVNFVYQFLGRKFFIFSQFLYDDHIKSRLMKDRKQFEDHKEEWKGMYPAEKAEKFAKDIRKLGVSESNQTYLDQFRELVTEIGNALGYVRMVRSGGLRFISDAIKFVPDITDIIKFEDVATDAEMPDCTTKAAENLDSVLTDLSQKFSEGSDYFKMLEDVFVSVVNQEKNRHLRNFYAIIPPLTWSYIDHIISCKEKVTKKGKEASFTDDGFALGVAFILKLLRQNKEFDGLHWFSSIEDFYKRSLDKIRLEMEEKRRRQTKEKAEAEISTMKLTKNKIETSRKEFELLFYTFRSSRVFFKDRKKEKGEDDEDEEEEEEEEEEEYEE